MTTNGINQNQFKLVSLLNPLSVAIGVLALSAGTALASSGTVIFSNSNGVSFGMNNGTITATVTPGAAAGIAEIAAGTTNATSGTVTFGSSAGNVTFGMNAGYVTASAPTGGGGGAAISAGANSQNTGTVNFANSNGVTFGLSNNGTMTASVNTAYLPLADSSQLWVMGNSSATVGGTNVSGTMYSNGLSLSAGNYLTSQSNQAASASNGSFTFQTLNFSNANNVTFGTSAGGIITASISPGGAGDGVNIVEIGTTGTTGTAYSASTGTVFFNGSNNITVSQNNSNQIVISGPTLSQYFSNTGTTFNGAGISGSLTMNTAGLQISLSNPAYLTTAAQTSASNISVLYAATNNTGGGTATLSGGVSFSNANSVTFYTSAGNAVVASISFPLTTAAQSSASNISAIYAATNNTGGGTATLSGGVSFSNANSVTFYTSAGNAVVASISFPAQTVQPVAWSGSGGSSNFSTLNFSNASNISFSNSNGSVQVVHNLAGTSTGFTGANISGSMTMNSSGLALSMSVAAPGGGGAVNLTMNGSSINAQTIEFDNANGVTWGLNGSTITASVNAGGGGATQTLFQPEVYGVTQTITNQAGTVYFRPFELGSPMEPNRAMLMQYFSTMSLTTFAATGYVSSAPSSSSGYASGSTGYSFALYSRKNSNLTAADYTNIVSFYSNTASIGYTQSMSQTFSTNVSTCTGSWSTSGQMYYPMNINSAGAITYGTTTQSSSSTWSRTSTNGNTVSSTFVGSFISALMSGVRPLHIPLAVSMMPAGEYWIGFQLSFATGTGGGTSMSNQNPQCYMSAPGNMMHYYTSSQSFLSLGSSGSVTGNWRSGFGSYSASANTTTTIGLSQISSMGSNASLYFNLQLATL